MKNLQPLSNRLDPARGSSLAQIKTHQLAREEDDKMKKRRLKGIIVLVEQFLLEQGYIQSLKSLQQESNISLDQVCVADNMDLPTIVTEYEEFYEFKFARKPKLFRTRGADDGGVSVVTEGGEKMLQRRHKPPPSTAPSSSGSPSYARPDGPNTPPGESGAKASKPPLHLRAIAHRGKSEPGQRPLSPLRSPNGRSKGGGGGGSLSLEGQSISPSTQRIGGPDASNHAQEDDHFFGRGLKPMPTFATSEMNDLAATIMRDILDVNPSVRWTDIAELENAKLLLREAVVMPVRYPELFQGLLRPWKGILLFGPPGTGKTLLAKAVATECNTTFFNISASSVVSKWRGDSEKLVRMLFDLALHYAPSTIFIDEIDSLMSSRSMEGEHEGSRRMKTELLTQMDGLSKRQGGDVVFVLAASNVPWDLDTAMLRRLEKRILVDLPKESARAAMFYMLLKHTTPSPSGGGELDWGACARMTEGLSGADIDIVCREAVMRHVRKLIEELENHGEKREKLSNTRTDRLVVTLEDIEASIACTKSSVRGADLKRFVQWAKEFGSGMSV